VNIDLGLGVGTGGDAEGDTLFSIGRVNGSAYADSLTGSAANETLDSRSGNDILTGNAGNDTLIGGDGADTLDGGAGADRLEGGTGYDLVFYGSSSAALNIDLGAGVGTGGDAESDTLFSIGRVHGSAHSDSLTGGDANEILDGRSGNDVLTGNAGNDTLAGGDGADTYEFARGDGQDTIIDTSTDGASDTFILNTGIDHDQLWFEQTGDDLLISVIGTSDQITVENWYASADNKIEGFETGDGKGTDFSCVEALVSAMASFSPPGGAATDLSDPTYDPLDSVLTTNWQSSA